MGPELWFFREPIDMISRLRRLIRCSRWLGPTQSEVRQSDPQIAKSIPVAAVVARVRLSNTITSRYLCRGVDLSEGVAVPLDVVVFRWKRVA